MTLGENGGDGCGQARERDPIMVNRRVAGIGASAAAAAIFAAGALVLADKPTRAADHLDPPARTDIGSSSDAAADIADIFFWNPTPTTVAVVLTVAGPKEAGVPPVYDRDVLYRVHLSNDGDPTTSEFIIDMRFGRDPSGNWGVQFQGVPGAAGPIVGPVQTVLTSGSIRAEAGLFDDPFFFDTQGFKDTRATGVLSITNTRNFFAGKNDTSMVVEFPRSAIDAGKPITAWTESRRITGS